jgi:phage terminase small subunit
MKEDNEAVSTEATNTEATALETIEVIANAQGIESSALTDKQKRFVMLIASGEVPSLVEAYIQAGYGQGTTNRKALRDNASQLANKPTVERAIQAAREAIEAKSHAALYASRRWILRRLREEANDSASPASARIARCRTDEQVASNRGQ